MSSPIRQAKDLDPALRYAPPWARDRVRPGLSSDHVTADEARRWRRRLDSGRPFSGDDAVLELQRRLALEPEAIPQPPPLVDQPSIGRIVLRTCSLVGIAAAVAWIVASLTGGQPAGSGPAKTALSVMHAVLGSEKQDALSSVAATQHARGSIESGADRDPLPKSDQLTSAVPPRREDVAAASPSAEMPPAKMQERPPVKAQEAPPAPPAPVLITRQLDADEIASLVKRGGEFIASGDIASARLVLQRAAEAGDVGAALMLAGTFDPNVLEKRGMQASADAAMARFWYERAEQLGSAEAPRRLQQLATDVTPMH
jgi:hypothetical protein